MKVKPGDIVRVAFLDHVEDGDESLPFEVFGRIIKQTKTDTVIGAWLHTEEENEIGDSNIKAWCIVNKAITEINILK
jgi:hypothetical protein